MCMAKSSSALTMSLIYSGLQLMPILLLLPKKPFQEPWKKLNSCQKCHTAIRNTCKLYMKYEGCPESFKTVFIVVESVVDLAFHRTTINSENADSDNAD